jgi:hypothetical protein
LHRDAIAKAALLFGQSAWRCEQLVVVKAEGGHGARDVPFTLGFLSALLAL